jgi:predicted N-acyltransferase
MHDQDLLAGSANWMQAPVNLVRRVLPRFLKLRTLMVGCAASEGRMDATDEGRARWIGQLLAENLKEQSRRFRCGMVVMKEFHFETRAALKCMTEAGFTRVPSLPMTRLNIAYANFEELMTKSLGKSTRKSLRRKFKAADDVEPITMEAFTDISTQIDELYPLYLSVFNRSAMHFEKLTKDFFVRLGREMPDKVRYFAWRQAGKAIAFSLCMVSGETLYDEYLGMDYTIALDLHLYFRTMRDIIQWGMDNGYRWYCSSALGYDPKLQMRCALEPLDLYVAHTSPIFNFFLSRLLPWLEPTRSDKTLKQFPNYDQLWGNS